MNSAEAPDRLGQPMWDPVWPWLCCVRTQALHSAYTCPVDKLCVPSAIHLFLAAQFNRTHSILADLLDSCLWESLKRGSPPRRRFAPYFPSAEPHGEYSVGLERMWPKAPAQRPGHALHSCPRGEQHSFEHEAAAGRALWRCQSHTTRLPIFGTGKPTRPPLYVLVYHSICSCHTVGAI